MARWLQQKHPRDTSQSPLMGKGPSDLTADNCPPPLTLSSTAALLTMCSRRCWWFWGAAGPMSPLSAGSSGPFAGSCWGEDP